MIPSPQVVALVTQAIGLLNQAMDLDFRPFDRVTAPAERPQLGLQGYVAREREMDRARACMLRAIATPAQRVAELDAAREVIREIGLGPVLDQLLLELALPDGGIRGQGLVPDGQSVDDVGKPSGGRR